MYVISEPSIWLTAVINLYPIFLVFVFSALLYAVCSHLRNRNADEKPKNH